ncbi:CPBP family intramembrane glutamic endopeptidase [Halomarina pelagica]|uniref:CPBP family intramembrane glutamic endopeptidase n=1 Tax=Halomarina pelagica TaxID=2961599 RepID=UPI0020C3F593|nr:CPBP family intramembrane glutamic endopeptidase [Halomarina sp. BND7]
MDSTISARGSHTRRLNADGKGLAAFFALAFFLSWLLWIPAALASREIVEAPLSTGTARFLGVFGPTVAALVVTGATEGRPGVRRLLAGLHRWRVGGRWYLFVLLWPPALLLGVGVLATALGGPFPDYATPPVLDLYPVPPEVAALGPWPLFPVVFLQTLLLGSPLGEELGWRGYALPRLQAGRSALVASVLIGFAWGLWHLPLALTVGDPLNGTRFAPYLATVVLDAILFTWVFNNTDGSLLLAILFHTSIAVAGLFVAAPDAPLLSLGLRAATVGAVLALTDPATLTRR